VPLALRLAQRASQESLEQLVERVSRASRQSSRVPVELLAQPLALA